MRLSRVVLREVHMRLVHPFRSHAGTERLRRLLIVEAHANGMTGYGECPVLAAPYYNEETIETAWHVLEAFLIPAALQTTGPAALAARLQSVRRHHMAKAGLEGAVWDLQARLQGQPLAELLGGTRRRAAAGIVIGLTRDESALLRSVEQALEAGYARVKLKVEPGWDTNPLQAVRRHFDALPLAVDANGAYSLHDEQTLRRIDEFGLDFIEQPLDGDDLVDHARLQAVLDTPICLDESIVTSEDARKAFELGSCRMINAKIARLGGLTETIRLHDFCLEHGVPLWCGGLLESGIGRAHNLAVASLPGFTLPGDISASKRYWEADVIEPDVRVEDGSIAVPSDAGIGVHVRRDRLDAWTVRIAAFAGDDGDA